MSNTLRAVDVEAAPILYEKWYNRRHLTSTLRWRGVPVQKTPSDMWVYQEIITEIRPKRIVEFGTAYGGSALFYGDILRILGIEDGRVLTIDVNPEHTRSLHHPQVEFMHASLFSEEAADYVARFCDVDPVLMIDDSEHSYGSTRYVLDAFSSYVTPGSYFIVEDAEVAPHCALTNCGRAVVDFLQQNPDFHADASRERFGHTTIYGGFLKKE